MGAVTDRSARVDAILEPWDNDRGPGCAVGVCRDGEVAHGRGYLPDGRTPAEWVDEVVARVRRYGAAG